MIQIDIKFSPTLVNHIARVERLSGKWDKLCLTQAIAPESGHKHSLGIGVGAISELEQGENLALPEVLIAAHELQYRSGLEFLEELFTTLSSDRGSCASKDFSLRAAPLNFLSSHSTLRLQSLVFPTVSPFIVNSRTAELFSWLDTELSIKTFHPLTIIGTFHLLFLQTSPLPRLNHAASLTLVWHLLDSYGYQFVRHQHFACYLRDNSQIYFNALRQAEKTLLGSWSTLNIWLELFLRALTHGVETLVTEAEQRAASGRLTDVQQLIISQIELHGPRSRTDIATQTGLNISTVKYNLGVLARRGHLKKLGAGRTTSYDLV